MTRPSRRCERVRRRTGKFRVPRRARTASLHRPRIETVLFESVAEEIDGMVGFRMMAEL
jgi:hypothetical protein